MQPVQKIPFTVDQAALTEALEPFYRLMGVNSQNVYDSPGFSIGNGVVTFATPATPEDLTGPRVSEMYVRVTGWPDHFEPLAILHTVKIRPIPLEQAPCCTECGDA